MKLKHITGMLLLIGAGTTLAAPPRGPEGGPGEGRPPRHGSPVVAVLDTDKDGTLSAGELKASPAVLAKLDANSDGALTPDELRVPPPRPEGKDEKDQAPSGEDNADQKGPGGPPRGRHPLPPVIAALDADRDGTISAQELANAPESLKQLDKDGDGTLTPEELRPQGPPPGGEGRPGGKGQGGKGEGRPGPRGGGRPDGPPPVETGDGE